MYVNQLPARPPGSILHLQKLFQAVEEARGLLAEGAAAGRAQSLQQAGTRQLLPAQQAKQQAAHQQQPVKVPQYPAPVKDDMGKNAKQLLKWLKAAAVDPEVGHADPAAAPSTSTSVASLLMTAIPGTAPAITGYRVVERGSSYLCRCRPAAISIFDHCSMLIPSSAGLKTNLAPCSSATVGPALHNACPALVFLCRVPTTSSTTRLASVCFML